MKYLTYFATCHCFALVVSFDVFAHISSAFNAIGNEISKVPNTVNTGFNAVSNEISKVPNTVNIGIDAVGNEFSKVPNTVNTGFNAISNEFSKVPNTVNTGIDAIGNEISKVPNTVNIGIDAVGHEISKVPKLLSDVGCSDIVTGIVISLLIECNPHAFISDTLDTEDVIMMNTCKSIEIASLALPLIADLATSPLQVICTMWVEDRLNLYSHLKGIDVQPGPFGTNVINNDELFYNLSKLNDQYCNNDCHLDELDDYEFIKPDERNEPPADATSSPTDVVGARFKRGIFGKALSIPTKDIAQKFVIKIAPTFLMKNGVPSSMAFRGIRGSVGIKMTTKISAMILNIREKRLGRIKNVYDIFVLTKTVPTTFTKKYYINNPRRFGRAAAENFQRELMNKEWKLLRLIDETH